VESRERKDVVEDGRYSDAVDEADRAERDVGGADLNGTGFLVRVAALFNIATRCGALLERLSRRNVGAGLRIQTELGHSREWSFQERTPSSPS
jgi:hypothetical protein